MAQGTHCLNALRHNKTIFFIGIIDTYEQKPSK